MGIRHHQICRGVVWPKSYYLNLFVIFNFCHELADAFSEITSSLGIASSQKNVIRLVGIKNLRVFSCIVDGKFTGENSVVIFRIHQRDHRLILSRIYIWSWNSGSSFYCHAYIQLCVGMTKVVRQFSNSRLSCATVNASHHAIITL